MTAQEQFKAEMAAIFKKYQIEMTVVEKTDGYETYAVGVNFYSFFIDESEGHSKIEEIDFTVGTWANSEDFE